MTSLLLDAVGAVTPIGLSGPETCASLRAGVSRIADAIPLPPPDDPIKAARLKAGRALQRNPTDWLLNMAAKALTECNGAADRSPAALLLCLPDASRRHPAGLRGEGAIAALRERCQLPFDRTSRAFETGGAGLVQALQAARELLTRRLVDRCLVGGVDSLVNDDDIDRLRRSGRLYGPGNPQGVVPGEGAVFLSLSASGRESDFVPLATLAGFAGADEPNPIDGPKFSLGDGLTRTVKAALTDARILESAVGFVVSDHNGERYTAWETTLSHARSYRTRREQLEVLYPASSVGHLGAAASSLAVMVAAMALARGHGPGSTAICEFRSEGPSRGACAVTAPPLMPAFTSPSRRRKRQS